MEAKSGPFQKGERLTAEKLNDLAAGMPISVTGGALTQTPRSAIVHVDQPENIYIKLTGKNGSSPIKYAWKQVVRLASGAWQDTPRTANHTDDYAIELNNSNLSTSDGYIYRAERSPHTGEWLFFLRRSRTQQTYSIKYKLDPVLSNLTCYGVYDQYNYLKYWGKTSVISPTISGLGACTGNISSNSTIATFANITFWYVPDSTGVRRTLNSFENNGTTPSPIGTVFTSNLSASDIPGKVGVDIVYNDENFWGYTYAAPCGANLTCQVFQVANGTAGTSANSTINIANYNTTANLSVTANVTPPTVQANDLTQPPSRHIAFSNTYTFSPEPADGYPAGLATWASAISQALSDGCNVSPTKNMTTIPICQPSVFAYSGSISLPTSSPDCGGSNVTLGVSLEGAGSAFSAGPVYAANGSITGSSYGVNTQYTWSYMQDESHGIVTLQTASGPWSENLSSNRDCVVRKTFSPSFTPSNPSTRTIGFNYIYKDQWGACTRSIAATFTMGCTVS